MKIQSRILWTHGVLSKVSGQAHFGLSLIDLFYHLFFNDDFGHAFLDACREYRVHVGRS